MKKEYKKIIKKWVGEMYGTQEAEDPSWSVEALAEELAKHFHEMYWKQELEYLKEDVENYLDGLNEYTLTEQQMYNVADKIRNSEWYCSINPEDIEYYVKRELEIAKEEQTNGKV